jgi:hypothetical protein
MTPRRSWSPVELALVAVLAGSGAVAGCGVTVSGLASTAPSSSAPAVSVAAGGSAGASAGTGAQAAPAPLASDVLARLAVKGRAPMTGYERTEYGNGWSDEDKDGCSTREEILQRDLTRKVLVASGRCQVVAGGVLADPYSGRNITFTRGGATSSAVQIDHVVALADSWQKGAQQLPPARRRAFANDPLNLLAVDGKLNQGKGAGDAATWLPPNGGYRCTYVARQVAVKSKYGLWITEAEKAAVARVLAGCPGQRVPAA